MMPERIKATLNYCKTHKLGLFLLGLAIFIVAVRINHGSGFLKIEITSPKQVIHYEKQSFFIYDRTPGFIRYKLRYTGNRENPDKNVRHLFDQYNGMEIFTAEICNSYNQCETIRQTIDGTPARATQSAMTDEFRYWPTLSKRLNLKNSKPLGRLNYSVAINPDLLEKIIPYYSLEISIVEGVPDNIFIYYLTGLIGPMNELFFTLNLAWFFFPLLLLIFARHFLVKSAKRSKP